MNWIAPITDKNTLAEYEQELRKFDDKYYIMFEIGIKTGMQMEDILQLKVKDVKGKDKLTVNIGAKHAKQTFFFSDEFKNILSSYIDERSDDEYLLVGYKGDTKPLSRTQAYRVLKQAGEAVGLTSIGSQSMRKTWAWNYYKESGNIKDLQNILSHSSPAVTYRYIGVTPNIETRLKKSSAKENERCRYELLKNNRGMKRINTLMDVLLELSDGLQNPSMPDSWYGKVDAYLEQAEQLAEVFERDKKDGIV